MPETMMSRPRKENYLSRLITAPDRRRSQRHGCHFLARAYFTSHGTRGIREFEVAVLDISQHGVCLSSLHADELPAHFYLYVGHYQHSIGCAIVKRQDEIVRCEFLKTEQQEMIEFLASVTDPRLTLSQIQHPLFGLAPPADGSYINT
jgi:hypothetical protein